MDVSTLLDGLNDKQRDAVAAPRCNLLVLAGAGSGKTRVLVHRIAWLMQVERCSPFSIIAVTFTNKAAAEMRGRVEKVIGDNVRGMWIGTFHGIAHRLLRAHHLDAGLPQDFQILDSDDQYRLIRRVLKALNLDEKHWAPRAVMGYINGKKDEGLRPGDIDLYGDPVTRTYQQIYKTYQETCDRSGLVDFAELLLRAHELWLNKPHILEHYRDRFQNILVDEFQDTNGIQYAWLRMLAGNTGKVMIVGDDDQSIYGWRGAKIENIQRFLTDYQGAETIRLEQKKLPLHRQYPESGQQRHRQQRRAPGQGAVDRGGRGRADFPLRRLQRGGRGALRGRPPQGLEGKRRPAHRLRHPLSLQRPVAGAGRGADAGRHALSHLWRPALLRAPGDQGRHGLPASYQQPRRRRQLRAGG